MRGWKRRLLLLAVLVVPFLLYQYSLLPLSLELSSGTKSNAILLPPYPEDAALSEEQEDPQGNTQGTEKVSGGGEEHKRTGSSDVTYKAEWRNLRETGGDGAVLVTGCMGTLGMAIAKRLLSQARDDISGDFVRVICVDRFPLQQEKINQREGRQSSFFLPTEFEGPNFRYIQGDIRDSVLTESIFTPQPEDANWLIRGVIHLASISDVSIRGLNLNASS